MSSNADYTELPQDEKDKLALERMAAMKVMNAQFKRRHAEVEFDRMAAERQNSAITNVPKPVKKDTKQKIKCTVYKEAREWDRDKYDRDNWRSSQHAAPNYSSRSDCTKQNRSEFFIKSVSGRSWDNNSSDEDSYVRYYKFAPGERAEISERVKGPKAKRSPQSPNSGKNEHDKVNKRVVAKSYKSKKLHNNRDKTAHISDDSSETEEGEIRSDESSQTEEGEIGSDDRFVLMMKVDRSKDYARKTKDTIM